MRRALLVTVSSLLALASCGGSSSSSESTTIDIPQGKCAPTEQNPTVGMAAITEEFKVVVWDSPDSSTPRQLEQIGDDPFSSSTGSDLTVVETVAVSTKTCEVFVGACCEPVSGITFFDKDKDGEWETLIGHLPVISPDGELLARVAYEELLISSVANPEETTVTINLPKADVATIYRAQWINGDEVALSGFTKNGAYLWIANRSTKSLREEVQISGTIDGAAHGTSLVGLIGVDESANVVTQNIATEQQTVVEYRYPDSLAVSSTDSMSGFVRSYVMKGKRSVMVSDNGALTTWFGNGDPIAIDGKYVWAG
jgi:hypothetical protein